MKVIGIEKIEYISKKTNSLVRGVKLHLVSEEIVNNLNMNGQYAVTIYVPDAKLDPNKPIRVGDCIRIFYNRFGSVEEYDVS